MRGNKGRNMFFSEPILFRTRKVILTDQRLFIDGTMIPLEQIAAVRPVRPRYFLPLLAVRLLLLAGIIYMLLQSWGRWQDDAGLVAAALPLSVALVLGVLLVWSIREIPTHVVQIETEAERINVMHVYNVGRAQLVVSKISAAMQDESDPA